MTLENYDKAVDNLLTAEMQAVEPVGAEIGPQQLLRQGHLLSQLLGPLKLVWVDLLPDYDAVVGHVITGMGELE